MAHYLGIEVTETHLKGALLRTAYKKLSLTGVYALPRAPGPEGLRDAARALKAYVDAALSQERPGQRAAELDGVYAALPGAEASMHTITLPRAVFRRGDRALMAELEGTVPFDIDACMVDAVPLGGTDPVTLYAVAARSARVEALVRALTEGGLEPREIGIAPAALGELTAAIPELAGPDPVALVHAQDGRAEIAVIQGGLVRYARSVSGLTTPAMRIRHLRQSFSAWQGAGGAAPTVAFLSGDEAGLTADAVAEATGLDRDHIGGLPQGTLEMAPTASPTALWEAPVAVALSLRGLGRGRRLDLRKGPLALKGGAQVLRERAPYLAAAAVAVVMFWGMATWARYQGLSTERNRLQETLSAVTQEVFGRPILDTEEAMERARGTRDEVVDPMPSVDAFDVVGVLSRRIPETIRHDVEQLDIQREHVQLQAIVSTLQDRDRVVEALSSYPCFPGVRPGRVTSSPDNRQKYTLDIELRCPGNERPREGAARPREGRNTESGGTRGSGA